MLSTLADHCYAECLYAECRYAECRGAFSEPGHFSISRTLLTDSLCKK
jgi:hypothetical protein